SSFVFMTVEMLLGRKTCAGRRQCPLSGEPRARQASASARRTPARRRRRPSRAVLLELDLGARLFELRLDRVRLFLVHALLDRLRRGVDEVLRLLQAKPGDGPDDLDHADLALAGVREDDVERRLLLRGGAVAARAACGRGRDRDRSGGGDAPLLLD